jgi:hypothetical protein
MEQGVNKYRKNYKEFLLLPVAKFAAAQPRSQQGGTAKKTASVF